MVVMPRDVEILRHVQEYRLLTREQVERLLFAADNGQDHPTKTSICRLRLRLLYHHGYLERFPAPVRAGGWAWRPVYRLAAKGAQLLAESADGSQPGYWGAGFDRDQRRTSASLLFLEHLLRTNDVRIAVTQAAQRAGWRVEKWLDDAQLKADRLLDHIAVNTASGRTQRVPVLPDAYFVLTMGDRRAHFFLELDRGTLSSRRWRTRVQAYTAFTASGQYEARYRTRSLRILTVTTSARRLANLVLTTEQAGGGRLFWFATFAGAVSGAILSGSIWHVAGEVEAKAIGGLGVDSGQSSSPGCR
jgi:hypothetical protein